MSDDELLDFIECKSMYVCFIKEDDIFLDIFSDVESSCGLDFEIFVEEFERENDVLFFGVFIIIILSIVLILLFVMKYKFI